MRSNFSPHPSKEKEKEFNNCLIFSPSIMEIGKKRSINK
jgi:hypothetical protein